MVRFASIQPPEVSVRFIDFLRLGNSCMYKLLVEQLLAFPVSLVLHQETKASGRSSCTKIEVKYSTPLPVSGHTYLILQYAIEVSIVVLISGIFYYFFQQGVWSVVLGPSGAGIGLVD